MSDIPKLVASRTLTGPLDWNASLIAGDAATAISEVIQQGGGDIEVYGSPTLVRTLMRHDLVDEYRVTVHPLVLGSGTSLFPQPGPTAQLRLVSAHTLETGAVNLVYEPDRLGPAT